MYQLPFHYKQLGFSDPLRLVLRSVTIVPPKLEQAAEEAARLMEERGYERALSADSVHSWRTYLGRFGKGAHAAEARQRLEAITFADLTIGVALAESWRPERASSLKLLRDQISEELAPALTRLGFNVQGSVSAKDGSGGEEAHVLFPPQDGQGSVVLWVEDTQGEPFEPAGHETKLTAMLLVFVTGQDTPVLELSYEASTPDVVYSGTDAGLYEAACAELAMRVAGEVKQLAPWIRR